MKSESCTSNTNTTSMKMLKCPPALAARPSFFPSIRNLWSLVPISSPTAGDQPGQRKGESRFLGPLSPIHKPGLDEQFLFLFSFMPLRFLCDKEILSAKQRRGRRETKTETARKHLILAISVFIVINTPILL